MGGVDKGNATGEVLDALRACALPEDCQISVVMGPHAPWQALVRERAAAMPWPTEVLVNIQDIAKLMADCDLAIGAAGTSAWERCCVGLPSLTVVLAANQIAGAAALQAAGCVELLGDAALGFSALQEKLAMLLDPDRLNAMQAACAALTDGLGARRLAEEMTHA